MVTRPQTAMAGVQPVIGTLHGVSLDGKMCDFCDDDTTTWLDPEARLKAQRVLNTMMSNLLDKLALDHLPPLDNRRG